MPNVMIEMWEGCSKEQKAEIAEIFARELSRVTGKPPQYIIIRFQDFKMSDWAIGGELASDIDWAARRKQ